MDKTLTAAEHLKDAYIRTRDSADQTQVKEQDSPVGYAEDQVMGQGERAARERFSRQKNRGKEQYRLSGKREKPGLKQRRSGNPHPLLFRPVEKDFTSRKNK